MARKGPAAAVLTPDGAVARTFGQIEGESEDVAAQLAGLQGGAVVSLQAPNVPAWPALLLGIWKAGGCVLLVDHAMGGAGREAAERACGAGLRAGPAEFARLDHAAADFGGPGPDLIKLTSGTSGAPRAILFSAAQLEADCDNVCGTMGIVESDVNYGVVAFSHSYGFSSLVTPLLCRGIPLVAAQDAMPRAVLAGISAAGATVLPAVPSVFQALSGLEGALPSLRLCISAGAPLRPETARAFRERFGRKVHTFYGASECGGIAYDAGEEEISVAGFVGRAMRGVEIEPLDGGEILVRSAAVGIGCFPEKGEGPLDGIFKPADFLKATPKGWEITSRRTDVINIGGRKTSPSEIEIVLLSHPSVREAVVFGVGSERRTEAICACVVVDGDLDEGALRAYCAERLAAWQLPRSIVRLEAIPVNARGKVSRAELAQRFVRDGL